MKKNSNVHYFIDMFNLYSVKILGVGIPVRKDNRMNDHMLAEIDMDTGDVVVKYNARKLARWSPALVVSGVFHEIRHVQQGVMKYDTDAQQIMQELDAERYAIDMMKIYHPEDLEDVCNHYKKKLRNTKWMRENYIHWAAFMQIEEFL
jgi:hypothetical protein